MARRRSVTIGGLVVLGAALGLAAAWWRIRSSDPGWREYPTPEQLSAADSQSANSQSDDRQGRCSH